MPMITDEYNRIRGELGLSQFAAGHLLGIKPRQAHRIAKGISPVPEPVAKLLKLIVRLKLSLEDVASL